MGLLVDINLLKVVIERILEASVDEVVAGVIGQRLLVEFPLEVFQGQCIVQNNAIVDLGGGDRTVTLNER